MTFGLKNCTGVTVMSISSNFDGEIETANLVVGVNLETGYDCRARHCYISFGEKGLVSDSKKNQ